MRHSREALHTRRAHRTGSAQNKAIARLPCARDALEQQWIC
jgi:hypothetical protein